MILLPVEDFYGILGHCLSKTPSNVLNSEIHGVYKQEYLQC